MGKFDAIDVTTFDISALTQEGRTELYRDAIRRAHAARAAAIGDFFRALAKRFERQPLLTRALVDSAAVLAMAFAVAATVSKPVSAHMQSVSIGGGSLPLLW